MFVEAIEKYKLLVNEEQVGQRLDKVFAIVLVDTELSRSKIQKLIDDGYV